MTIDTTIEQYRQTKETMQPTCQPVGAFAGCLAESMIRDWIAPVTGTDEAENAGCRVTLGGE